MGLPFDIFVFDFDGVIKRGNELLPGVKEFLSFLDQNKIPFYLMTNHPFISSQILQSKLNALGLKQKFKQMIGAAHPLNDTLKSFSKNIKKIFVIGDEDGLASHFERCGFHVDLTLENQVYDAIVFLDDDSDNWNLTRTTQIFNYFINNPSTPWVVANPDLVFPTQNKQYMPTTGTFAKWIIDLCQLKEVDLNPIYLGKPYPPIYQFAEKIIRENDPTIQKNKICMVGDTPGTDIKGANQVGWSSILLKTGNWRYHRHQPQCQPTHTFDDMYQLLNNLAS